ncbi:hypothetical protein CHARACLAT_026693 [Characodon lateralis]|uniref:Uncharacterized protein n=1 Tax=Characodon lateralis TaxID=208331 RepID=A0ABU7E3S3_9TELE|nr:hypothetical protein [Characodon lateralis]
MQETDVKDHILVLRPLYFAEMHFARWILCTSNPYFKLHIVKTLLQRILPSDPFMCCFYRSAIIYNVLQQMLNLSGTDLENFPLLIAYHTMDATLCRLSLR